MELIRSDGIQAMEVLDCAEQNSNRRHGLMYFDIALTYHTTINVVQHEQMQIKTQNRIMIPASNRLPSQIGSDMLTAKVIAAGGN